MGSWPISISFLLTPHRQPAVRPHDTVYSLFKDALKPNAEGRVAVIPVNFDCGAGGRIGAGTVFDPLDFKSRHGEVTIGDYLSLLFKST